MKNEFYVTAYRFHVKDRNTLLIQGWFAENEMGENQLVASIDDEKLVYKTAAYRCSRCSSMCGWKSRN